MPNDTLTSVGSSSPRRILIRGVNWLGDAVMSTPALLRLRQHFPDAWITLLTHEKLHELWLKHPAINEVVTFAPGEGPLAIARKLRAGNFDVALVLPNSPRSAMEVWLAGIPLRIGYARPWRNRFLTQAVPARAGVARMQKLSVAEIRRRTTAVIPQPKQNVYSTSDHHLYEYLHLAAALGADPTPLEPQVAIADEELRTAASKFGLAEALAKGRLLLGLNPGAEYGPAKRWPVERFAVAAREVQQQINCVWLILGGKGDRELAAAVAHSMTQNVEDITPPLNLAGQTSLRELCAVFKLCRVVLTNDTGPMHLAAALGTPVVVPFGSTSPELTGPGLPGDTRHQLIKSDAPCSPCFLRECPIDFRCMHGIAVERVVEAIHLLLNPK